MAEEGSIRTQRIEFAREATEGVFPTSPSLLSYSDNVTGVEWSPSPGVEPRRALGGPDINNMFNGPEEHEVTVSYDLQKFIVDGSGDPADASGDGVVRDSNNDQPDTHSLLVREENEDVPAEETVNESTSKDTRLYLVGEGGNISGVTFSGDPSSQQPVTVEITYDMEKVREYQLDQPGTADSLDVTNNGSTSVDVTVEDDSGNVETVTVAAGVTETTTKTDFTTLDAVRLSKDVDGTVTVAETGSTDTLVEIQGSDFYGHGEGDRGVPALDGGTREGTIGTSYETILDDTIERPDGTALAYEVNSVEFTVENDISSREQLGTPRMAMSVGNRTATVGATVVGPTQSVQDAEQSLGEQSSNVRWTLTGGYLEAVNARLTDFGGVSKQEGEAAMSLDNTFTGETVNVST